MVHIPPLSHRLAGLLETDMPRFSATEMQRRAAAIDRLMTEADVSHLLVYGSNWTGVGVPWLTHWMTTSEAALVCSPGRKHSLFIQYHNHTPQAQRLATGCAVEWGGPDTMSAVIDALRDRGAGADTRIGIVGPLSFGAAAKLSAAFPDFVDLNRAFTQLRLVKSAEEIDWMRIGAWFSDRAMASVAGILAPGVTERELADCCERAWVPLGGQTGIHFFGSTSMAAPDCQVPRQFPSVRPIVAGDVVFCEISGAFQGYSGQVLRSFTVNSEPATLYSELHAVAEAAFDAITAVLKAGVTPAELVAASGLIEDAGFTTCDDLVHGYGGGYLPPVIGSQSRPAGPVPDLPLQTGMMVVVQPNVVTRDGSAGVQTGECIVVTDDGWERIHQFPRGIHRV